MYYLRKGGRNLSAPSRTLPTHSLPSVRFRYSSFTASQKSLLEHPSGSRMDMRCLTRPCKHPPWGGPRPFYFHLNEWFVERIILEKEKNYIIDDPNACKNKNLNIFFCIVYSWWFPKSVHRVIYRLKNLSTSIGYEYTCPTIYLIIYKN